MSQDDIRKPYELVDVTAGELGMLEADRRRAKDLLKEYFDKRDNIMNGMITLLGQSDVSSIDNEWKECCSNGKEALSQLNDEIPPRDGEGLAGIRLDSFHRGELKVWEENAKAEIALAAKMMGIVQQADAKLMDDCKTELETIHDNDEVIQEAVRGIFPKVTDLLKDTVVNVAKLAYTAHSSHMFDGVKDMTDQAKQVLDTNFNLALDSARKRGALKQRLLRQIGILKDTNDRIGDWKIDEVFEKGKQTAENLSNARDGDYEARDWKDFGDRCKEALGKKRDDTKHKSQELFQGLYPTLMKQNEMSFKTLYSDPKQLEDWNNQLVRLFQDANTAIEAQDKLTSDWAEGPLKQAAVQTMNNLRLMIKSGLNQFGQVQKTSDDELSKN